MSLDMKLLERLLHEAEGTSLDFKSAQYPFEQATVEEKSELLKDILAFANSWRRTTAYILIGVEEVEGGRSNVVGVAKHLDDAKLHQFVNGKTQRPVEFSYQVIPIEATTIGVIEIPVQERPTYLNKRYGKLREQVVTIRDGSSTRAATPDEIARMGAEEIVSSTSILEPRFRVWLVDDKGNEVEFIEAEYHIFERMSDEEILACTQLLKREFPLETDFGSRSPMEQHGTTLADRVLGLRYSYIPASDEQIAKYSEEEYPRWIGECEDYLSSLHETLQSQTEQPWFTFAGVNEGNRPGHDALINLIAEGELKICAPPYQDDADEEDNKIEIGLPAPPQAPRGRWSPNSPSLSGLTRSLSALTNPRSGINRLLYPGIESSSLLPGVDRDNRRDPNAFYYKPNRSTTPEQSFSLECKQWRHGTEEEHFSGQLFFDQNEQRVSGTLVCEVHAENLSSPLRRTAPVEISIKRLNVVGQAQLLVQDLLKAVR